MIVMIIFKHVNNTFKVMLIHCQYRTKASVSYHFDVSTYTIENRVHVIKLFGFLETFKIFLLRFSQFFCLKFFFRNPIGIFRYSHD